MRGGREQLMMFLEEEGDVFHMRRAQVSAAQPHTVPLSTREHGHSRVAAVVL
jgi:hypothetical protein